MSNIPYTTEHLEYGIAHHSSHDGMSAHVTVGGRRVKSFKGETAHMDAQRHAFDLFFEKQRNDKSGHLGWL